MTTIISDRDRWHIPPAAEAASASAPAPAAGGGADRLARIAGLDAERMADALAFLAGYAPAGPAIVAL